MKRRMLLGAGTARPGDASGAALNRSRRTFLSGSLALTTTVLPEPPFDGRAWAQEGARVAKVALAAGARYASNVAYRKRLSSWLAELGYDEGRNLAFKVFTVASPGEATAQADAQRVIDERPDVILVPGAIRIRLFRAPRCTIPVVFLGGHEDDIVPQFVADPRAPGGNVTGSAVQGSDDMPGKSWEWLVRLRPGLRRIGDLHTPEAGTSADDARVARIGNESVARKLGVEYREIAASEAQAFEATAMAIRRSGADGLGVAGHWWTWGEALLAFAERSGIPAVFEDPAVVRRGGLLSFRDKDHESERQGVEIAVRILRGEDPGVVPVRFVRRFHLAVNLRTAREMRLEVPASIIARADEVVR